MRVGCAAGAGVAAPSLLALSPDKFRIRPFAAQRLTCDVQSGFAACFTPPAGVGLLHNYVDTTLFF